MKRSSILFAAVLIAACGTQKSIPWSSGSFAEVAAATGDKMLMLDFITDN
ncbi:MAG: hypothetical protein JSU61_04625 [Fidelibacterota bacterium]|nr:MAG: hypothetical protein JSU61_04625 [Candidatus Neomarinimicrobiota bacterium]